MNVANLNLLMLVYIFGILVGVGMIVLYIVARKK